MAHPPITSSPAAAYRADMSLRRDPFGPHDDAWLRAASVLHGATNATRAEGKRLVAEADALARATLGDRNVERLAATEWDGRPSAYDAILVLADRVHYAGALNLAARMLDDLASAPVSFTTIAKGRLLALRARVEWKLGRLDDALDRYDFIDSLGAEHEEPELRARALQGIATIAQLRGNVPEHGRRMAQALSIADEHGLTLIARRAHVGLTVVHAKRGDFDQAFASAWTAFEMSGDDMDLQAEALQNLGQLMLVGGHLALARSCFAAMLTRPIQARALLPALGGLATTSARLGAEATVEWAVREIWRAQSEVVTRYELAEALLEAADALHRLGRRAEAERYHAAGLRIAETSGYHELVHVAARPASEAEVRAVPLGPEATAIGARVAALEPERLPARLRFDRVLV